MEQWSDGGCESRPAEIKEEGCEEGERRTEDGDSSGVCCGMWRSDPQRCSQRRQET